MGLSGEPTELRPWGLLGKSTGTWAPRGTWGVAELQAAVGSSERGLRDLRLPKWCGLGLQELLGEFTELKFGGLLGRSVNSGCGASGVLSLAWLWELQGA